MYIYICIHIYIYIRIYMNMHIHRYDDNKGHQNWYAAVVNCAHKEEDGECRNSQESA